MVQIHTELPNLSALLSAHMIVREEDGDDGARFLFPGPLSLRGVGLLVSRLGQRERERERERMRERDRERERERWRGGYRKERGVEQAERWVAERRVGGGEKKRSRGTNWQQKTDK